jgi:hypothetical protein
MHNYRKMSYPIAGLDRLFGFLEAEVPRISRQSAHEGGKVVNNTHLPGDTPSTHFC